MTKRAPSPPPVGLPSREVCALLKIPASTLNYWIQIGLVSPTLRGPQGHRVEQYWSVRDVVIVRAVRQLRTQGASLNQVRKAAERLREWRADMSNARLYWDGNDILIQSTDGNLFSGVHRPNQLVWLLTALPLASWQAQLERRAKPVDVAHFEQKDRGRRERRLGEAVPIEHLLRKSRKQA